MGVFRLLVVFTVAAVIGVSLARPSTEQMMEVLLRYKQLCINMSGSDEGYRETLPAISEARTCLFDRIDLPQMKLDASTLTETSRKEFFDKYCPKFNESVSCLDGVFEGISKCTGEEEEKMVPVYKAVAYGVVELLCENDGQFMFEIQKPEFMACVAQLKEIAEECRLSNETQFVSLLRYGEDECHEAEKSKECVKERIETCNAPGVYHLYEVFYNKIMKFSNCDKYTKVVHLYDNNIDNASSRD
ncbi:27 kDa glycoprotein-like [Armigeres subalbatus]|uniref:27 kDa glycoprotein-like n=1 Tax=Armigeres subalbatus TaxID=124917 RepID=UPI002ED504EA